MTKRHLKLKWKIIFGILIFILLLFICLRFIGTKGLIIKEYKVVNKNIDTSFYGFKIVHFSDLHYGMSVDEKVLSNLVDKINKTKPDIVVFTGDLIDKKKNYTESDTKLLTKYLSKIKSSYGNYYVNGDDDENINSFDSIMVNSNFKSLNNNYEVITSEKNKKILISGISTNANIKIFNDIFKDDDYSYKIIMMHYPDNYDLISKYNFDLVLSGHSHNGQVRLPYIGALVKMNNSKKYYDPYYKINDTDMYISGGIGNSKVNLRLFNTPSFNLYRLVDK
ncbi:MAG: metallophosphoesterase [Bacilli bacterium]|mgnify:FL=1|jgi:predicted MPP superfamily phosphohydrolase